MFYSPLAPRSSDWEQRANGFSLRAFKSLASRYAPVYSNFLKATFFFKKKDWQAGPFTAFKGHSAE